MSALQEYDQTRQIDGEPKRRWFASLDLDLIVWLDDGGHPIAFQLCYEKRGRERALTWRHASGFEHAAVDSGEQRALHHKGSPTLIPGGSFERDRVLHMFLDAAGDLPAPVHRLVSTVLAAYPHSPALPAAQPGHA